MFLKILTVAGLASFEIYAAIPAGFAFGLSPWIIFFASVTGGLAGVFVAAYLGDRIRKLFSRNKAPKEKNTTSLVYRLWNKYGVIGLGFLGTLTVGAPVSLAVGIGFAAPLQKLVIWCSIGVITRCILFTLIGYYGMQLL